MLTDSEFDSIVERLEGGYDNLSPEFRARVPRGELKTFAHALHSSEEEMLAARQWSAAAEASPAQPDTYGQLGLL